MNLNNPTELATLLEALLLAHSQPLTIDRMMAILEEDMSIDAKKIQVALNLLADNCQERVYELKEVASGYRLQVRSSFSPWVGRLWEEKSPRYSRALLETLALIAYRQPITRGEIEDIRGVAVNSQIIKTLQERDWIRIVGYKDVPGKPAMLATTKGFLDYFNLKSLEELPSLSSIKPVQEELPVIIDEFNMTDSQEMLNISMTMESSEEEIKSSEKNFKDLLNEWNEMEEGIKTDFSDLLPTNETEETTDNSLEDDEK